MSTLRNCIIGTMLSFFVLFFYCSLAQAAKISQFDTAEWNDFTVNPSGHPEDWVGGGGFLNPGFGGQDFDAEYLYYKLNGSVLSIVLQTGFDLNSNDGKITWAGDGKDYYAGDIALSFDGDSDYEYAIDFGFLTRGNSGALVGGNLTGTPGRDDAGLYEVTGWNNDVKPAYVSANPFAMESGNYNRDIVVTSGSETILGDTSYFRQVSFDITGLVGSDFELGAHWTMSCGNDGIDGHANVSVSPSVTPVPEPATALLLGTSLLGILGYRKREDNTTV